MPVQTVQLDLVPLTPDQQVARLKEQYLALRGQNAVVRAVWARFRCVSTSQCSNAVIGLCLKAVTIRTISRFIRTVRLPDWDFAALIPS